ncbi:VWA domain-containing protein [Candidatus Woesearchaeota archaeon]|nr:VWA domain-containing protein [Candidatus Woesearchaeota archaeon]
MLSFAFPSVLWALSVIPIFIIFYVMAIRKKKKAAMKFSNLMFMGNTKRPWLRQNLSFILIMAAMILLIIAIADPHLPLKQTRKGVNVVLAIDISGSMQATDYQPTRLEAAKESAELLLDKLEVNDHVGIVVFESGATTAAYLSPLKDKVINKLRNIEPKDGMTAIGDGLSLAVDMASSIPNKKKVIILLSDGVSNSGVISPEEAVVFAKLNKIKVFTIGMGSEEPVVLGYDWFGRPQYAELDETTLKKIAQSTDGEYFKSVDDNTLKRIYTQLTTKIEREKEDTSIKDYVIAAAFLVLLAELYLRYGRKRILN